MHEDQLVELVAMAIFARVYSPRKGQKTWSWPDVPEGARDNMRSDARAAIAAIAVYRRVSDGPEDQVANLVAQAILDKETRRSRESAREMGIPFEPTDWSPISKQTRGWWKNTARTAIEVYRSAIPHKAA